MRKLPPGAGERSWRAWGGFFDLISLDIFRKSPYAKKVIEDYLGEPEEVPGMYSEALKILDRNTTRYMIEELQKERQSGGEEAEKRCLAVSRNGCGSVNGPVALEL